MFYSIEYQAVEDFWEIGYYQEDNSVGPWAIWRGVANYPTEETAKSALSKLYDPKQTAPAYYIVIDYQRRQAEALEEIAGRLARLETAIKYIGWDPSEPEGKKYHDASDGLTSPPWDTGKE